MPQPVLLSYNFEKRAKSLIISTEKRGACWVLACVGKMIRSRNLFVDF